MFHRKDAVQFCKYLYYIWVNYTFASALRDFGRYDWWVIRYRPEKNGIPYTFWKIKYTAGRNDMRLGNTRIVWIRGHLWVENIYVLYICRYYYWIEDNWVGSTSGSLFFLTVPEENIGYELILGCFTHFGLAFYNDFFFEI